MDGEVWHVLDAGHQVSHLRRGRAAEHERRAGRDCPGRLRRYRRGAGRSAGQYRHTQGCKLRDEGWSSVPARVADYKGPAFRGELMAGKGNGSSSTAMAVARIIVGIMFLFFAQYKLMGREFAHGGYEHYVTGYEQVTAVSIYKPFLRATLHYPVASG